MVGAGLSGLVAAQRLRAEGIQTLVVDKGRSVGGRLATRRIGDATLDHGAQFFTVRSPEFQQQVDTWLSEAVIDVWCEGFEVHDGYPRYRASGGMNQLARSLTEGLDIVTRAPVQSVSPGSDTWAVSYEEGARDLDEAVAVLLTAPVPQSLALLRSGGVVHSEAASGLDDIKYHRVIALLATTTGQPQLGPIGAKQQPDDPSFSFVADNKAKGISTETALTFHTAHARSAELWDLGDDEIRRQLLPHAATTVGLDPSDFTQVQVKKWRYSGPVTPWPDRSVVVAEQPGPILMAGDAFGGPKVEGAFLSGRHAAETLIGLLGSTAC